MTPSYTELIEIQSSRAFLKKALELHFRNQKKGRINLSEFSRRCGFASRSYLHEVLSGKKRLSRNSLAQIRTALKLPKNYFKLLELLVTSEKGERDFSRELQEARMQILKEQSVNQKVVQISQLVAKPATFQVYAALGTEESGASLGEICQRTGLRVETVIEVLQYLESAGALKIAHRRYFALATHLDFLGLNDKEGLVDLCQQVSQSIHKNSRKILDRDSNLIFYSAHSIPKARMHHLKEKLKTAVAEIVDQEQKEDGDTVVQVFLGSWS